MTDKGGQPAWSSPDGFYEIGHSAGTWSVTASAPGYFPVTVEGVIVVDDQTTNLDFNLTPFLLNLESVYPTNSNTSDNLNVTLTGKGFDGNTRVSMSPDACNSNKVIGSVRTLGSASGVAIVDNIAYVAAKGLHVIDISDASKPIILGSIDTQGNAYDVSVVGSTAYVTGSWHELGDDIYGLHVIDISDPTIPNVIGSFQRSDLIWKITVVSGKAYVASGYSGLEILDVEDPTKPKIIGSIDTPGSANDVAVVGSRAYVSDGWVSGWKGGLHIVDVSNPIEPEIIGSVEACCGDGVAVEGNIAYIAGRGLYVVDITDSISPAIIGYVDTHGWAQSVEVIGTSAYIADWIGGIQILDISNPFSPVNMGIVQTPGDAYDVTIKGTKAYVADYNGLQVMDITDPSPPINIGSVYTPHLARDVAVTDTVAYVTDPDNGLQVIDISDVTKPVIIDSVDTPGVERRVEVIRDIAYVTSAGLNIIDVSDPFSSTVIGAFRISLGTYGVKVIDSTAYVTGYGPDDDQGLYILDVGDPTNPTKVGSVETPGDAVDVAIIGSTAYVAGMFRGLHLIDISNPSNPTMIDTIGSPIYAMAVKTVDENAYVAYFFDGLKIMDISDPKKPTIIGPADTPGALDVAVADNIAYVAADDNGLQVVDITNKTSPVIIGSVSTPSFAEGVTVSDGTVYVAGAGAGLIIPVLPVEITPVEVISDTEINVTLPSPPRPGNYTIRAFNNTEYDELIGVITFEDRMDGPDEFEEDDTHTTGNVIVLNGEKAQKHNFHDPADEDWVKFYGIAGETYEIKTSSLGNNCDPTIELYDTDGSTLLKEQDTPGEPTAEEALEWVCLKDGVYYARIKNNLSSSTGRDEVYDLTVKRTIPTGTGFLTGLVLNKSGEGIRNALIKSETSNSSAITLESGYYMMIIPSGTHTIAVEAEGYITQTLSEVLAEENILRTQSFTMIPYVIGDMDEDGDVDGLDLAAFGECYAIESGRDDCSEENPCDCDLNNDGNVDQDDLSHFATVFGGNDF